MRFCSEHWGALRAVIAREGVGHLVGKDGRQAIRAMVREIEGTAGPDDFDPLMAAHNAIVNRVIDEVTGVDLFFVGEDGVERCPICYANELHRANCQEAGCTWDFSAWIEGAGKWAAEEARRKLRA